jgi:hypothetical protein
MSVKLKMMRNHSSFSAIYSIAAFRPLGPANQQGGAQGLFIIFIYRFVKPMYSI